MGLLSDVVGIAYDAATNVGANGNSVAQAVAEAGGQLRSSFNRSTKTTR